jgi:hypothetical protein
MVLLKGKGSKTSDEKRRLLWMMTFLHLEKGVISSKAKTIHRHPTPPTKRTRNQSYGKYQPCCSNSAIHASKQNLNEQQKRDLYYNVCIGSNILV